jgi:hypothetical protein
MPIFFGGYMADGGNVKCHQCKKDMFIQCIASCGEQYPPCVVVENCHSTQQLKAETLRCKECETYYGSDYEDLNRGYT